MLSRRALFFFLLSMICLVLVPLTPAEFRWVPIAAAGLAVFWGVVSALDEIFTGRRRPRPRGTVTSAPFAPPPRPGKGGGRS